VEEMNTVKVKPWGEGQGDHVLIDSVDFDPTRHELIKPEDPQALVQPVQAPKPGKPEPKRR
jgi:hypothetical protein